MDRLFFGSASSSKNYHQIMDTTPSNPPVYGSTEKWTEIEHLPEWDEEFYHVYTAKKFEIGRAHV